MAGSRTGGATIEIQEASKQNLFRQMENLKKQAPESTFKMIVKLLFDIKFLAQNKLKADRHILTSRLRNSLYVKTLNQKEAKQADNGENYSDKDGKTYSRELDVDLNKNEGAVGTNVEYAAAIEFGYTSFDLNKPVKIKDVGWRFIKRHPGFKGDSFLYWASKNVDVNKRVRETSKELLGDLTKQGRKTA